MLPNYGKTKIAITKKEIPYNSQVRTSRSRYHQPYETHAIKDSEVQLNNIYLWSNFKVVMNYVKNVVTNFASYIAHRIN